jgi:SAM-dependent methyltransferase
MIEFESYGDTYYRACPICAGARFPSVWRLPFAKLSQNVQINKMTVQHFPTFGARVVYEYCCCETCDSIFLNPYSAARKGEYASWNNDGARSKIQRAGDRTDRAWKSYVRRYRKYMSPHFPGAPVVLVDAACGGGEYLMLAREDPVHEFARLVGLELSPISVEHLEKLGIEAYQHDLDSPDSIEAIEPESVDFVIFSEAFEHVVFPLQCLQALCALLKSGGRLFFSAQRVDPVLPLRPYENQCITEQGMAVLLERLNCRAICIDSNPGKWLAVIEKVR